MPAPQRMFRKDTVLAWAATVKDRYGKWKRSAAYAELKVRWVGKTRTWVTDPQGKPVNIDVTLSSPVRLADGTPVWRGTYTELVAGTHGTDTAGKIIPTSSIYEVIGSDESKDHRGKTNGYLVYLRRLGDTMPEIG